MLNWPYRRFEWACSYEHILLSYLTHEIAHFLFSDEEWLLVFRGYSRISSGPFGDSVDMYKAWESGTDTSYLICSSDCSKHYRRPLIRYWGHFGHSKVYTNFIQW